METPEPLTEPPPSVRPPRGLAVGAILLSVITLGLGAWTAVRQWETESKSNVTAAQVEANRRARCDTYRIRMETEPSTPTENAMRREAIRQFPKTCGRSVSDSEGI